MLNQLLADVVRVNPILFPFLIVNHDLFIDHVVESCEDIVIILVLFQHFSVAIFFNEFFNELLSVLNDFLRIWVVGTLRLLSDLRLLKLVVAFKFIIRHTVLQFFLQSLCLLDGATIIRMLIYLKFFLALVLTFLNALIANWFRIHWT